MRRLLSKFYEWLQRGRRRDVQVVRIRQLACRKLILLPHWLAGDVADLPSLTVGLEGHAEPILGGAPRPPVRRIFPHRAPPVRPYPVINNEDGAGAHDRHSSLVLLTRSSRKFWAPGDSARIINQSNGYQTLVH